jgi:hypothetical protein
MLRLQTTGGVTQPIDLHEARQHLVEDIFGILGEGVLFSDFLGEGDIVLFLDDEHVVFLDEHFLHMDDVLHLPTVIEDLSVVHKTVLKLVVVDGLLIDSLAMPSLLGGAVHHLIQHAKGAHLFLCAFYYEVCSLLLLGLSMKIVGC